MKIKKFIATAASIAVFATTAAAAPLLSNIASDGAVYAADECTCDGSDCDCTSDDCQCGESCSCDGCEGNTETDNGQGPDVSDPGTEDKSCENCNGEDCTCDDSCDEGSCNCGCDDCAGDNNGGAGGGSGTPGEDENCDCGCDACADDECECTEGDCEDGDCECGEGEDKDCECTDDCDGNCDGDCEDSDCECGKEEDDTTPKPDDTTTTPDDTTTTPDDTTTTPDDTTTTPDDTTTTPDDTTTTPDDTTTTPGTSESKTSSAASSGGSAASGASPVVSKPATEAEAVAALKAGKKNLTITAPAGGISENIISAFASSKRSEKLTVQYSSALKIEIAKDDVNGTASLDFTNRGNFLTANQIQNTSQLKNSEKVVQLNFANDGDFGGVDKVKIKYYVGSDLIGKTVAVYEYVDGRLVKVASGKVNIAGKVTFDITHYGQYIIAVE